MFPVCVHVCVCSMGLVAWIKLIWYLIWYTVVHKTYADGTTKDDKRRVCEMAFFVENGILYLLCRVVIDGNDICTMKTLSTFKFTSCRLTEIMRWLKAIVAIEHNKQLKPILSIAQQTGLHNSTHNKLRVEIVIIFFELQCLQRMHNMDVWVAWLPSPIHSKRHHSGR